eukprot:914591-Pyramimonas_sp.AAC.1
MAYAMLRAIQETAAQRQPCQLADLPVAATEWGAAHNYEGPIDALLTAPIKGASDWTERS